MSFLRDLALAHQRHEGWFVGSRSYRNNNPGNLRAGPPMDSGRFTIYRTYEAGLAALEADLAAKIYGTAGTIKRLIVNSKTPYEKITFLQYIAIYAPAEDANNPASYTNALCRELAAYNVKPTTTLPELARLARGEVQRLSEPIVTPPPISPEARLRIVKRAILHASPERLKRLTRLRWRLELMLQRNPA